MRYWPLLLLLSLLGASDGDTVTPPRSSSTHSITSRYLCADKSSTGACSVISNAPQSAQIVHCIVANDTGCTAYSVSVEDRNSIGGDWFTRCTLTDTTVQECRIFRDLDGPLQEDVRGNVATATNCTDLDVICEWYTER